MLKEDCEVGMQVIFGRGKGEKTLGEIVKLNPTKAKVKTLESRGSKSEAGSIWGVPYILLTPAKIEKVEVVVEFIGGKCSTYDNIGDAERTIAKATTELGIFPKTVTVNGVENSPKYTVKIQTPKK